MKKVVLYTRVSTDEQKNNGFSLQDQQRRLEEFCARKGYEILKHYEEDYSAKNFKRPKFGEFLADLKRGVVKPNLILCVRPDRFSRNFTETYNMLAFLKKQNVKVDFIEQLYDESIPENKLSNAINIIMPQIENERRALNTVRGMRQALREGRWTWKAPIGYKNDTTNKKIFPDSQTSPLVIEAFEKMATGIYSAEEIRKSLVKKGLKCCKNNFLNLLRNHLYEGMVRVEEWENEPEEIVQGIHEPLITRELFCTVQGILNGKRKTSTINITRSDAFELRPFLECDHCTRKLTGSYSKSRNGQKYPYYHCQNGCKERFSTEIAHSAFRVYLSTFKPPIEVLKLYYAVLEDVFRDDDVKQLNEKKLVEAMLDKNKSRRTSVEDKYIDGLMDFSSYQLNKKRLETEENDLLFRHLQLSGAMSSYARYIKYSFSLLHDLPRYYSNSTLEVKHRIIGSIFPEKLIFSKNGYRTSRTNELVSLLFNVNNGSGITEIKKPSLKNGFPELAPPPGVLPWDFGPSSKVLRRMEIRVESGSTVRLILGSGPF